MKQTITLPLKAFSINAMYCRNRAWKSQAFNEWSSRVFHKLDTKDNLEAMTALREFFDPSKHCFEVSLKFFYPEDILFTKKGALSARAHDISNIEKPLIDLIFLPTYYDKPSPYGCKNINIDDKFITKMSSEKLQGDEHKIEIEIVISST